MKVEVMNPMDRVDVGRDEHYDKRTPLLLQRRLRLVLLACFGVGWY